MSVEKKVIEILAETLEIKNPESININSTSEDVEGWDSLAHLQIIIAIESEFGIKFKTSEINKLKSVKLLVKKINELFKQKK